MLGEWTTENVVFTLDSTHQLDGVTYFWRQSDSETWNKIDGNILTINSDTHAIFYVKAVNSMGYESDESEALVVKLDKTSPVIALPLW